MDRRTDGRTDRQTAGFGKNPNFLEKSIDPPDFSRDFWIFGFFQKIVIGVDRMIIIFDKEYCV